MLINQGYSLLSEDVIKAATVGSRMSQFSLSRTEMLKWVSLTPIIVSKRENRMLFLGMASLLEFCI